MERWAGKIAVITGASSGIGLETARALVRYGMVVIGLSRRPEKMQKDMSAVKGPGKFYAKACDVSNEQSVIEVFQWIEKNFQTIHVLVNNAGVLKGKYLREITSEEIRQTFDVNVLGLLHCTQQSVKIMKKNNNEAHIVNVNSVFGHAVFNVQNVPFNIYPATKHAVTAICQSYIHELKSDRIRVSSISPGLVKTELFEVGESHSSFASNNPALNPEDVANSIVHIISAPQHVQITELIIKPSGVLY